jgi:hypothetical protein
MTKTNASAALLIFLLLATPIHALAQPENRIGPRMIYDPVNKQFLLYGGATWQNNRYHFYGELWSYQPETNTWTQIPTTNQPLPRFNHMLTYIPQRHQLFLFGGWSTNDKIDDTWIYDIASSTWIQLHPTDHPSARSDASIAYDPTQDAVVLYSGYLQDDTHTQDTWIYSFQEENWIQQHPANPPLGQYGHYMIYATETGQLLMYPGHWSIRAGGVMIEHGYGGNIWEYDIVEETWTEHQTDATPPGRYWGHIAYDSTMNRIILYGGHGAIDYDDTWVYNIDDGTWERAVQTIKPSKRGSVATAYDPENHIVVLFGGFSESGQSLGDTWILDCETLTWSQQGTETQTSQLEEPQPEPSQTDQIPGYPTWITLTTIAVTIIITRLRRRMI